jgi:hypothetical protein
VIREASQKKKHHTVHPEPIDGHFDLVYSLFIPPMQVRFPLFLFFPNPFNIPCPRSTIYISYTFCSLPGTAGVRASLQVRLRIAYQSARPLQTESASHEVCQSHRFGSVQLRPALTPVLFFM